MHSLKLAPAVQVHVDGQSLATLQRRVQMLVEVQKPDLHAVVHGPPTSVYAMAEHTEDVDFVPERLPCVQTFPPPVAGSHVQLSGQSFAVVHALVHSNDGLAPKHSCD